MDDILGKILKFEQLFALFLEFDSFATKGLRKKTGQVGDGEETEKIAEKPDPQSFRSRHKQEGARNFSRKRECGHAAEDEKTYRGGDKRYLARKEDAGHDDDEQVEGDERTLLQTGGVNEGGNDDNVAGDLEGALPCGARHPANQRDMQNAQEDPGKQERKEGVVGA